MSPEGLFLLHRVTLTMATELKRKLNDLNTLHYYSMVARVEEQEQGVVSL